MATPSEFQTWCGSVPWHYRAKGPGPRGLVVLGNPPVPLLPLFDGTRRVVAAPLPPVETVLQVSDGLVELLDREGLGRVDIFGHGGGAAAVHAFVRRHPDRVDRVVLSGFGLWSPVKARWARWLSRRSPQQGPAERTAINDLFRKRVAYRVDEPELSPGRVMLVLDADGGRFTRHEQEALAHTYPGAIMTFASGHELEHKLELFFRVDAPNHAIPPEHAVPQLSRSA